MIELLEEGGLQCLKWGAFATRVLDDGRVLSISLMTFGKVRLCISSDTEAWCYDDGWCYEHPNVGLFAMAVWDGEDDPPLGWHRHINSGRRRENGNPKKEYISR